MNDSCNYYWPDKKMYIAKHTFKISRKKNIHIIRKPQYRYIVKTDLNQKKVEHSITLKRISMLTVKKKWEKQQMPKKD